MSEFKTIAEPAAVICPKSLPISRAYECEFTLNIGMFFDGTDNNRHTEPSKFTNTNVVRLWEAYKDDNDDGFFRYYVSGVGTPFTEIDEKAAPGMGAPFGAGGEARIVYGLLQVINSVHAFIHNQVQRFDREQLAALCSDTKVPTEIANDALGNAPQRLSPTQQILSDLGLSRGLVDADEQRFLGRTLRDERRDFITRIAAELAQQLAALTTRPRVSAIYLDVFGFSRGAAQARVFTTWLHDLMLGRGQLFGVPSYVRMLGLFDTVSSVGLTGAAASHGHHAWATARNLRIHPEVRNCVHYVALHELRTNFPCDSVGGPEGVLPPNAQEHYCPGAHSDVGGGYAPGVQGKAGTQQPVDPRVPVSEGGRARFVPDDSRKLSQLPLNTMWEAANKACELHEAIPWVAFDSEAGDRARLGERYAMARDGYGRPLVARAVASYFENCGVASGLAAREALREHGLRYLAWRYQVTRDDAFEKLPSVTYARMLGDDPKSLAHYRDGQWVLAMQIKLLSTRAPWFELPGARDTRNGFSPHAPEIFERMKTLRLGEGLHYFFDAWVHDSYAAFIGKFEGHGGGGMHRISEAEGYVRWRGLYCGSDEQLNALRQSGEDGRRVA